MRASSSRQESNSESAGSLRACSTTSGLFIRKSACWGTVVSWRRPLGGPGWAKSKLMRAAGTLGRPTRREMRGRGAGGGGGIGFADDGPGEFQAATPVGVGGAVWPGEHFEKMPRSGRAFVAGVAADEDRRIVRLEQVFKDHRAGRRAGVGHFEAGDFDL